VKEKFEIRQQMEMRGKKGVAVPIDSVEIQGCFGRDR